MANSRNRFSVLYRPFKKVALYQNWKEIIRKAWSIRFMAIAAILSACEIVLPMYEDTIPKNLFASLSFFFVAAAFISRIIAQRNV